MLRFITDFDERSSVLMVTQQGTELIWSEEGHQTR